MRQRSLTSFFNNDKCNRICFNVFIWWAQGLFQPTDIHTFWGGTNWKSNFNGGEWFRLITSMFVHGGLFIYF